MSTIRQTAVVDCPHCEAAVAAEVLETLVAQSPEDLIAFRYAFLKCPRCGAPLLTVQEDFGPGWDDPVRVFPPRDQTLGYAVPSAIRTAFSEAQSCHPAKAYTAAAIMCRKAVEGLCEDQGAKGRNLAAKLKSLKDDGIIEQRLFEWADELRLSGNEAAHDVSVTVKKEDAGDLLEFTRALMEYVYTFGAKFQEFKKRRTRPK